MRVIFIVVIFVFFGQNFAFIKENAPKNKEEPKDNVVGQYLKSGMTPEKYDGAIYDDVNIVVVEDPVVEDKESEDEPRLFDFRIPQARTFLARSKRSPVLGSGTTGVAPATVSGTEGLVPYDAHIDPDFPAAAPVARGLKNVPEGWNLDKNIDYEFKTGFRKAAVGQNPSYAAERTAATGPAQNTEGPGEVQIEGPYIMTSSGLAPFSGSYGSSSYGGYGYGSSYNSGYGSSYGGYGSAYTGGYGSSLAQAAAANLGLGYTNLFG